MKLTTLPPPLPPVTCDTVEQGLADVAQRLATDSDGHDSLDTVDFRDVAAASALFDARGRCTLVVTIIYDGRGKPRRRATVTLTRGT